jgi:hypothetical protein
VILVQVISIWLGIVCIAVALDVLPSYLSERSQLQKAQSEMEKEVKTKLKARHKTEEDFFCDDSVRSAVAMYRNMKRIEFGLAASCERTSQERKRGLHRRVEAA